MAGCDVVTVLGGRGAVGRALVNGARRAGRVARVVGRGEALDGAERGGVLLVATHACDLPAVLDAAQAAGRTGDLVLLQNGAVVPLLASRGADTAATQVVLQAAARDGALVDGGGTVAHGARAREAAELLSDCGVECGVLERDAFAAAALAKLLWASVFWVLAHGRDGPPLPVGRAAVEERDAIRELADELAPLALAAALPGAWGAGAAARLGTPEGRAALVDGLVAYSLAIPSAVPSKEMALREFAWRNGALLAAGRTPAHVRWLRRAGVPAELVDAATSCH